MAPKPSQRRRFAEEADDSYHSGGGLYHTQPRQSFRNTLRRDDGGDDGHNNNPFTTPAQGRRSFGLWQNAPNHAWNEEGSPSQSAAERSLARQHGLPSTSTHVPQPMVFQEYGRPYSISTHHEALTRQHVQQSYTAFGNQQRMAYGLEDPFQRAESARFGRQGMPVFQQPSYYSDNEQPRTMLQAQQEFLTASYQRANYPASQMPSGLQHLLLNRGYQGHTGSFQYPQGMAGQANAEHLRHYLSNAPVNLREEHQTRGAPFTGTAPHQPYPSSFHQDFQLYPSSPHGPTTNRPSQLSAQASRSTGSTQPIYPRPADQPRSHADTAPYAEATRPSRKRRASSDHPADQSSAESHDGERLEREDEQSALRSAPPKQKKKCINHPSSGAPPQLLAGPSLNRPKVDPEDVPAEACGTPTRREAELYQRDDAPFLCNLCNSCFKKPSLVKSHFRGPPARYEEGCWHKHGRPDPARWNDHPSVNFDMTSLNVIRTGGGFMFGDRASLETVERAAERGRAAKRALGRRKATEPAYNLAQRVPGNSRQQGGYYLRLQPSQQDEHTSQQERGQQAQHGRQRLMSPFEPHQQGLTRDQYDLSQEPVGSFLQQPSTQLVQEYQVGQAQQLGRQKSASEQQQQQQSVAYLSTSQQSGISSVQQQESGQRGTQQSSIQQGGIQQPDTQQMGIQQPGFYPPGMQYDTKQHGLSASTAQPPLFQQTDMQHPALSLDTQLFTAHSQEGQVTGAQYAHAQQPVIQQQGSELLSPPIMQPLSDGEGLQNTSVAAAEQRENALPESPLHVELFDPAAGFSCDGPGRSETAQLPNNQGLGDMTGWPIEFDPTLAPPATETLTPVASVVPPPLSMGNTFAHGATWQNKP